MSLKCQKDSYAQTHSCKVVSCVPATLDGKECYEVTLEDTVLFPEGGGQPHKTNYNAFVWGSRDDLTKPEDRGKIDGIAVMRVEKRGTGAVHYMSHPLATGREVTVEVDWVRRFDHMQQHSGQHLITALTDAMYGIKTTSWNLAIGADSKCHVELNTKSLSQQAIQSIEDKCNESIRNRIPMTPRWLEPGSKELEEVRSRGLPDDFVGLVRVVDIEGVDSNMCCGTHVSNLSDIQCIKLLHTESKRGSTLLYYVAGNRVLNYLSRCTKVEKELTKLLSTGLEEHTEAVDRTLKTQRQSSKIIRNQLREIALLIAHRHLHARSLEPVAVIHRDEGDNEFMNVIASELTPHDVSVFVTVGGDKGPGQFLLAGNEQVISELGPRIADLLDGRGGGRKGRFQGKANKIENRSHAEKIIRETVTKIL